MQLYQLVRARCNPFFEIKKEGNSKFVTKGAAGYGWFSISEKMIEDAAMLELTDDINSRLMNGFAQNCYSDSFKKVRSSFVYTRVHSGDKVIPIWAYLYIQNDDRGSSGRHFLVGEGGEGIAPCRMITARASCWDDSQEREMYDTNAHRPRLPEIEDSKIENLLPEPSINKEYFTPKKDLLNKVLCFVMEQISLINYDKKPEQAKTLIIKETPENTLLWINAITHLLNLTVKHYVSMFTFSTNVSDIISNSKKRLLNEKEGNAPYFIIAGAHPEDSTVNFGTDGERYIFMDPKKGSFAYDSPNLKNPYFADIMKDEAKIAKFWHRFQEIPSFAEALFQYDWQSKKERLANLKYNEYLELLSNNVQDKSAIKDIYDNVLKRSDLEDSDYENDFALFKALIKNYPKGKEDILLRQLAICLKKKKYEKTKKLLTETLAKDSLLPVLFRKFINFIKDNPDTMHHFIRRDLDKKHSLFMVADNYESGFEWEMQKKYFEYQLNKVNETKSDAEKYAGYAADFLLHLPKIAEKRPKLKKEIFALEKKFLEGSEASDFFKIRKIIIEKNKEKKEEQKEIQNSELFPVFKECLNSLEAEELKKIAENIAALLDDDIEKMIDQIKGTEEEAEKKSDKGAEKELKKEAGLKEEVIISLVHYAADRDENIIAAIYVADKDLLLNALKDHYGKEYKDKFNEEKASIKENQYTDIERHFMDYCCSNGCGDMKAALAARRAYQAMSDSSIRKAGNSYPVRKRMNTKEIFKNER